MERLAVVTDAPKNPPENFPQRWISEIRNRVKQCQRIKSKPNTGDLPKRKKKNSCELIQVWRNVIGGADKTPEQLPW